MLGFVVLPRADRGSKAKDSPAFIYLKGVYMIVECRDGTARDFSVIIPDSEGPESPSVVIFECDSCGAKLSANRPSGSFDKLFGHRCDDD
jgi:hypothetical protein